MVFSMNRLETMEMAREIGKRPAYPNMKEYRKKVAEVQAKKLKKGVDK